MSAQSISFGYEQTVTGAIAPSIGERGKYSLQVINSMTQTLADEYSVMQEAANNEATAKKKQIGLKALGEGVQSMTQFASAGIVVTSTAITSAGSGAKRLGEEQGQLDAQLKPLEEKQTQFREASKTNEASGDLLVRDADAPVDPSVQARMKQFATGDFGPAEPEVQEAWNNSARDQNVGESNEEYQTYLDSRNLDQEAMKQMSAEMNKGDGNTSDYDKALSGLDSQISNLNKKINNNSNESSNRANKWNNIGNIGKEVVTGVGSTAQSLITMSSSKWATSEIYSQNMSSLTQMMMKTLESILQAAYQGVDSTTNMMVSAAQIVASAA